MAEKRQFGREPAFLLHGLSYMRDCQWNDHPRERIGGMDGGGGELIQKSRSVI
jgi:hypothetical protein